LSSHLIEYNVNYLFDMNTLLTIRTTMDMPMNVVEPTRPQLAKPLEVGAIISKIVTFCYSMAFKVVLES